MGKLGATGLAIGAGGAVGSQTMVGEADAVLPVVIGAAAGGVAINETYQFLDDHTAWNGADEPPEGLTGAALEDSVASSIRKRQSTNASTFIDNGNILDGTEHVAWADAKIASIEALNAEETKANVTTTGQEAVDAYEATLKKNLLRSYHESVKELENFTIALDDHPDTSIGSVLSTDGGQTETPQVRIPDSTATIDLPNGETEDVREAKTYVVNSGSADIEYTAYWTPAEERYVQNGSESNTDYHPETYIVPQSDATFDNYLNFDDWNAVWSKIETICQNVRDGVSTWVDGVYEDVQAGEISTGELLTPREIAELTAEEEDQFNQAMADLMALNVPVNMDREAEVYLSSIGATLYGHLGVTGGGSVSTGTIDPSADDHDYYLTYDVSEAHGDWGAYQTGVDGGVVTFTEEPHPDTLYTINTAADETAEVHSDDFVQDGENWTVNISEQVGTAISEVSSVEFYAPDGETQNVTVLLKEQFEIVTFRDTETDEEHDSATYEEPQTPQDDQNYMTQEEWEDERDRLQGLIDDYEESQNDGGGGWLPDIGGIGGAVGGMFSGIVVIFLLIFGIGQLTNN